MLEEEGVEEGGVEEIPRNRCALSFMDEIDVFFRIRQQASQANARYGRSLNDIR